MKPRRHSLCCWHLSTLSQLENSSYFVLCKVLVLLFLTTAFTLKFETKKIKPLLSVVAQMVKHLSTMWETWVQALGWENPLEKEMAIHSSTIAWKIPWTERSLVGYSLWGHKESDTTERLHFTFTHYQWF